VKALWSNWEEYAKKLISPRGDRYAFPDASRSLEDNSSDINEIVRQRFRCVVEAWKCGVQKNVIRL